ncbi:MAG: ABC transporter permease [Spirochaetales bacterium]|nr:ABC transporter permease [Spirochaetales bacterium]
MSKLITIAFRNIIKNKKRSLYIGLAIFISCFILLISNAVGNGTADAILAEYYYQQAGDVVLLWEKALEIEKDSPSRIYLSQFEADKAKDNKQALASLESFLKQHESEIDRSFKVVRRGALLVTPEDIINVNVYGMSEGEWIFLKQKKLIQLEQGQFDPQADSTISISRLIADTNNLAVGDWVTLDVTSAYGANNSLEYKISAIYKNGVPWNNDYIYMTDKDARLLYDFDKQDLDSMRIYLKNKDTAAAFTRKLDSSLTEGSGVLRALEGKEAGIFFTQQAEFFKSLYAFFVTFLLIIIGFGIRATVRMNLFERMSEFGTLRAIGYNRRQNFFIIFCEIFLLAFFSLLCAFLLSSVIVLITSQTGIYVGSGAASWLFGGDYLYPRLEYQDVLFALAVIFILSLLAPFKPGLKLCYQKIADVLLKRQEKRPLTIMVLRNIFKTRIPPS